MSNEDATMLFILIVTIWVGWPLHRISDHLRELLDLAKKGRSE